MILDRAVWGMTASHKDFFEYRIGSVSTNLPWYRPTYDRAKALISEILSIPEISEYRVDLVGGCLFTWNQTWDLDLLLFEGPADASKLEKIMETSLDLALNEYRIKLDISYNFSEFGQGVNYFNEGSHHIKFRKVSKRINDIYHEVDLLDKPNSIEFSENLIKATWPKPHQKLLDRIASTPTCVKRFDAKLFTETDELYFMQNSNHQIV